MTKRETQRESERERERERGRIVLVDIGRVENGLEGDPKEREGESDERETERDGWSSCL
jgi:hypothetical protein